MASASGLLERGSKSMPSSPRLGPHIGPLAPPASPMLAGLTPMCSPTMKGLAMGCSLVSSAASSLGCAAGSMLVPLEADLQPQAMQRAHEFREGRRVFHVHFGHGFVKSLEAEPAAAAADGSGSAPQPERIVTYDSQRTHNINLVFDAPKYKDRPQRLRAYYAVPKMVVIPSTAALRRQKLLSLMDLTPPSEPQRVGLVRSLLASNQLRAACVLVSRWKLHAHFEPSQLLEHLVNAKMFSAAMRFAREFGLSATEPYTEASLYRKMLHERQFEGPLKHAGAKRASIDGEHTPDDVLRLLVGAGHHAVALKYVHKFGASERFPPQQLVSSCLEAEGKWTVQTCGLLLKYVKVFGLETLYPVKELLDRVERCGVTVHDVDGKYVLKGRRRAAATVPGTPQAIGGAPPFTSAGWDSSSLGTSPPLPSVILGSSAPS